MPAPFTQLAPLASPGRRYGSFAGRIPVEEPEAAPPVWIRTDHRMGRFAELRAGVRYLEPVVIQLPLPWDISANDYVISDSPIDIEVEPTPIIVAGMDVLLAFAGGVHTYLDSPSMGRTLDRLAIREPVSLEIHPTIQVPDIFLWGPARQAILEAERLLGISIE